MPILYVTYQDKRKNGTQLFYGRAVHPTTIGLDTIADRIQQNCSMKKSDVRAVLSELVEVMNYELSNSNKVKIDGLGIFYVNLRSSGAIADEDYNANQNVKGIRIRFLPEGKKKNGHITRALTEDITFKKAEF